MVIVREGEKKDIAVKVERTRGTGGVTVTVPQVRILTSTMTLVAGHDWLPASWDETEDELYALFDSTLPELATVGMYFVEMRCTIGVERYSITVPVCVSEVGP